MCEIEDARLCRDCSIVTDRERCPLCDTRTVKHPERKHIKDVADLFDEHDRPGRPDDAGNPQFSDTEQELVVIAQRAISSCNWTVGECAARWCQKYARGRTDADFGSMVGLSGDQVYQRRRTFEMWDDVRKSYSYLKWSHFYVALAWNDGPECLAWASENQATVAEMKAWRRMQHGADLTVEAEDPWPDYSGGDVGFGDPVLQIVPETLAHHPPPDVAASPATSAAIDFDGPAGGAEQPAEYVPFRSDAQRVPDDQPAATPSADMFVKRVTAALERSNRMLAGDTVRDGLGDLPHKQRARLAGAIENLVDTWQALQLQEQREAAVTA